MRTPTGNAALDASRTPEEVPFNLILEPLHFGVVPETVLPILAFLVPVVILAGMAVPYVNRYLDKIVRDARREVDGVDGEQKLE